jgi:glycosyltransferase involved in cell wall biosynthesis
MRIAHFLPNMWLPGGMGQYIQRLSQAQHQAGHEIFFVDPAATTNQQAFGQQIPIAAKPMQAWLDHLPDLGIEILHVHAALSGEPSVLEQTLANHPNFKVLRSMHNHGAYCPSGSRYLQNWKQPCDRQYSITGCLWGHLIDHCGSVRPPQIAAGFQRIQQELQTLAQIPTIANSTFVKQQMVRAGYAADQIHVALLPAPAQSPQSSKRSERPTQKVPPSRLVRFLYLGRLTPQKGWPWLLKAFAQLSSLPIPCHLDIAGTGSVEQEQALRTLAQHLQLADKITLHGWVESSQAQELLHQCRALIFPSVWHEPAGLVTLEAAAAGRAVIASNVGGIPEYAQALGNSLLVEPNDIAGLATAMARLTTDTQLAEQLGQTGQNQVNQLFSLDQHERTIMHLYQQALASKS